MKFCGKASFGSIFENGVISPCYYEVVFSCALFTFVCLNLLYRICALPLVKESMSKPLISMLISLCTFSGLASVAHLVLRGIFSSNTSLDNALAGYIVMSDVLYALSWGLLSYILKRDYGYRRPSLTWVAVFFIVNVFALSYESISWTKATWWKDDRSTIVRNIDFLTFCVRLGLAWVTLICYIVYRKRANYAEYQPLLSSEEGAPAKEPVKPKSDNQIWMKQFLTFLPYVWPKTWDMYLRVFFCVIFMLLGRVVNLLSPLLYKKLVDELTPSPGHEVTFDAMTVGMFVLFKWLQGGTASGSIIKSLQNFVWIPVKQYTSKQCRVTVFNHIQCLSLNWHLNKKTGEVTRILDRGTDSVASLISTILTFVLPIIMDLCIGIFYLVVHFDLYIGAIVVFTLYLYVSLTTHVTTWRTPFRKKMNELDNDANKKAVDALMNFETVKYFSAEDFEVNRYKKAIENYQGQEWLTIMSLHVLNTAQSTVLSFGVAITSFLCAYKVAYGSFTVGDFVLFLQYMNQLSQPLNWFGSYYRQMQQNLIDMDNMFHLMEKEPDVKDLPGARPFIAKHRRGSSYFEMSHEEKKLALIKDSKEEITKEILDKNSIVFKNVTFRYPGDDPRLILNNVSLSVPPGTSCALVGATGSGKSTIVRLLFRFYDITSGEIFIDGQSIYSLKQRSLRDAIGVVPQDTMLFHDSVGYNIQYGNQNSSVEDVIEASKAAEIHQHIERFKEGYDTLVGERGLRLSGGEKQRVAMARMILKDPHLVVLDEATSALDTKTERAIQASLDRLCANRTTLIVAHRLSTIVNCDQIIVLQKGEIIERGNHSELLALGGVYADMWESQLEQDKSSDSLVTAE
eukprot:Nk52_evm7s311 gene=Nk52_evmTU7s311